MVLLQRNTILDCHVMIKDKHEIPRKDIGKEERRTFRPEERRQW